MPSSHPPTPTPVERYYDALDRHEYDALESILSPTFVQERPDRRFEGRDAFVRFMREERPSPDTAHVIDDSTGDGNTVVVEGRVLEDGGDGDALFAFVDTFTIEKGSIVHLETRLR
nr:nuclear transport factor 2 family protein [Natronosalvus caseinilyticus]